MKIKGKAFVLGNDIDTDQIIPAQHLVYSLENPEEKKFYGRYALSGVPDVQSGLPKGNIPFTREEEFESDYTIIIAGSNFGCGSSREHAPFALQVAGARAVVAESYARIFYRNAVDGGFVVPYETDVKLNDKISTGDELVIDRETGFLYNVTTGDEFRMSDLGDVAEIIDAGGIFEYARLKKMV